MSDSNNAVSRRNKKRFFGIYSANKTLGLLNVMVDGAVDGKTFTHTTPQTALRIGLSTLFLEDSADSSEASRLLVNMIGKTNKTSAPLGLSALVSLLENVASGGKRGSVPFRYAFGFVATCSLRKNKYIVRVNALQYIRAVVQSTSQSWSQSLSATMREIVVTDKSNLVASTAAHVLQDLGVEDDAIAYYTANRPKSLLAGNKKRQPRFAIK